MNRKLIRDQKNDISIIIGNLPKRLQKKIADETGASCCFVEEKQEQGVQNAEMYASCRAAEEVAIIRDLPRIDLFLRMGAEDASDVGEHTQLTGNPAYALAEIEQKGVELSELIAIPGILRLNAPPTTGREERQHSASSNACVKSKKVRALRAAASHPMHQTKQLHPKWFNQLLHKDIPHIQLLPQLHDLLLDMLQRNLVLEQWQMFCEYHMKLRDIFTQLLMHQLKFCCEQKVDTFFWKLLFYNVIEHLKNTTSTVAANQTINIINNGLEYYTELLQLLNEKYTLHSVEHQLQHRFEFIAKVSAQKFLICLGDLSRYKCKLLHLNDFSIASNFYQRAQKLIPTNGIPYNQLAVLAIYNRKKFDAIYFHMRSLMSSNAIYSARESLQVLFDEIRKKYEETEMKTSPIHNNKANIADKKSKSLRKEVWIHPDGVRRLHRTDVSDNKSTLTEENRLNELTIDDLLRRFTSLYLYVIGKLFTGIGMETIQEHQRKLLIQLNAVLKRNPLIISSHRLLKIAALNIFIMEHNNEKDARREIRYHAFVFCNQMFALLLRKSNELFTANITNNNPNSFQDLNNLLQFATIWCRWLAKNIQIWEPIRCEEHFLLDPWHELQLIFNNIDNILGIKVINLNDYASTILEEDKYLVGFTPISKTSTSLIYDSTAFNEEAQFYSRLVKIGKFSTLFRQYQDRLENQNESNFCLEDLNAQMKNVLASVKSLAEKNNDHNDDNTENIIDNGHKRVGNVFKETQAMDPFITVENEQVSQLSKLKKQLEAKSNVKRLYSAKLEEILKFVDTKWYIEVRPKYLLPDTNCFIDCLEDFEKLVQVHKRYVLIIPLIVVKELDGLSKGVKIESYEKSLQKNRIHHFDDVSTRAKKSLDFIKTTNNNVKCATTKGSIINASLFALVEEEHVSNDDKILATALALSKTMSTETSKDGKCFIQTELVLITTDRNLRVKALSRNLAVSELSEFQQWANDCQH